MDDSSIPETVWVEYSTDANKPYFYNEETKHTTWTIPAEYLQWKENAQKAYLKTTNWKKAVDKKDKAYYYDKVTKQTQWNVPTELVDFEVRLLKLNLSRYESRKRKAKEITAETGGVKPVVDSSQSKDTKESNSKILASEPVIQASKIPRNDSSHQIDSRTTDATVTATTRIAIKKRVKYDSDEEDYRKEDDTIQQVKQDTGRQQRDQNTVNVTTSNDNFDSQDLKEKIDREDREDLNQGTPEYQATTPDQGTPQYQETTPDGTPKYQETTPDGTPQYQETTPDQGTPQYQEPTPHGTPQYQEPTPDQGTPQYQEPTPDQGGDQEATPNGSEGDAEDYGNYGDYDKNGAASGIYQTSRVQARAIVYSPQDCLQRYSWLALLCTT